jgi:hypothetical protein
MMRIIRLSLCGAVFIFATVVSGSLISAHAQQSSPIMIVTWHASGSEIPASYAGKALPNNGSSIVASVVVFDGGKAVDVSGDTIYWYLNDTLLGGGPGSTSFVFKPFAGGGGPETLKAEIPNYPGGMILETTPISVASPAAVIDAPYPAATFSANPLVLSADPYFFPVSTPNKLSYAWTVNSKAVGTAEDPETLKVSLGPGTSAGSRFSVSLSVTTADNSMAAADERTLTYQPLP